MSKFCTAIGLLTLAVGLVWYPLGVGEWSSLAFKVYANYQHMVASGKATDEPSALASLMAGTQHTMTSSRLWEAAFLVFAGVVHLVAAWKLRNQRHTLAAPQSSNGSL